MDVGGIVVLIAGLSLLAALLASLETQRRSVARGDGVLLMWGKGGLAGATAMMAVWVAYFVIGNIIKLLA